MLEKVVSHETLVSSLNYDPHSGVFTWIKRTSNRVKIGDQAGSLCKSGYMTVRLENRLYPSHKLAIYYCSGVYPLEDVDHIDANRSNNAITNLRIAGKLINAQNRRNASRNSSSGVLGIHPCKITGKWRAQILAGGKKIHLGRFESEAEAHSAYLDAKRKYHIGNTL